MMYFFQISGQKADASGLLSGVKVTVTTATQAEALAAAVAAVAAANSGCTIRNATFTGPVDIETTA